MKINFQLYEALKKDKQMNRVLGQCSLTKNENHLIHLH
jgi:hypothetical protein